MNVAKARKRAVLKEFEQRLEAITQSMFRLRLPEGESEPPRVILARAQGCDPCFFLRGFVRSWECWCAGHKHGDKHGSIPWTQADRDFYAARDAAERRAEK